MQLDSTRIAVRERGVLDTLDLALHVLRVYAGPLLVAMALGAIPMMILNYFLVGWMLDDISNEFDFPARFLWHMTVLVFLEAPLASVFATSYLGQAVFLDRPKLRSVVWDVAKLMPRVAWCHLLVRGVGFAWLLLLATDRLNEFDPFTEAFLPMILIFYASAMRAFRPFINEVVLLERNPLLRREKASITVGRRSSMLHGTVGGDLFARWIGSALIGALLCFSMYGTILFICGVFLNDWSQGWFMLQIGWPISMWSVAAYMTVVRFLSYLDTRIRQEGWEVELRIRAEASRVIARLN